MQGVYQLEFTDGSVYIGLSNNVGGRLAQHLRDLERRVHKNKYVQAKFNKYGAPSFKVLDTTNDSSILGELETKYIIGATKEGVEVLNIAKNPRPPKLAEPCGILEDTVPIDILRLNVQIVWASQNLQHIEKELERLEDLKYEYQQKLRKARDALESRLNKIITDSPELEDLLVAELGEFPDERI